MKHFKVTLSGIARFISVVLHPLFMSVYCICLLFLYTDFGYVFYGQFFRFLLPICIATILIPVDLLILMKYIGFIKDYEISDRRERFLPFIGILCSYILLFLYFQHAELYAWFLSLCLAACILLTALAIITNWWNISAHMASFGGLIGGFMAVCYFVKGSNPYVLFIVLFILAGFLGTARLINGKYTPAQVYTAFLLGFFLFGFCVWVGANFAYFYYCIKYRFI